MKTGQTANALPHGGASPPGPDPQVANSAEAAHAEGLEGALEAAKFDVHARTEYAHMQRPLVRRRAAMRIQRHWRRRQREKYSDAPAGEKPPYLREDSHGDYTDLFHHKMSRKSLYLREPMGDFGAFHQELTEKIKTGCYHELDFRHPHFVRLLYQALRLEHITANELLTAKLMYDALFAFNRGEMPDHPSEHFTRTPLTADDRIVTDITYMSDEAKARIRDGLAEEPDKYHYYSIEFSDQQIVYLLMEAFSSQYLRHNDPHAVMLLNFLKKYKQPIEAQDCVSIAEDLKGDLALFQGVQLTIEEQLDLYGSFRCLAGYLGFKTRMARSIDKEVDSICFLRIANFAGCQIPGMKVVDTPGQGALATFTLPTIDTLNLMQSALHEEEMTLPAPVTGALNTRMIRAWDDIPATPRAVRTPAQHHLDFLFPSASELPSPSRPIELVHPDAEHTEKPHDYDCYVFFLTWHDLFHAWRSGANYKERIRRLKRIHDEKAGLARAHTGMSKTLWELSDLDTSQGRALREKKLSLQWNEAWELLSAVRFAAEIRMGGGTFDMSNENLWLIAFDVAKNPALWTRLNGDMDLVDLYSALGVFEALASREAEETLWALMEVVDIITPQIKQESTADNRSLIEIYLRYRLFGAGDTEAAGFESDADPLFSALEKIGYENIFYWSANTGIYIQEDYRPLFSANKLSNNSRDQLAASLRKVAFPQKALLDQAITRVAVVTGVSFGLGSEASFFRSTPLDSAEGQVAKKVKDYSDETEAKVPRSSR